MSACEILGKTVKARMKPRVEVVFLPPVASLGLHVCTPGAAWGHRGEPGEQGKGGMKLEWNGGIEGQQGSRRERCPSGLRANQKGGKESWMDRGGVEGNRRIKARLSATHFKQLSLTEKVEVSLSLKFQLNHNL